MLYIRTSRAVGMSKILLGTLIIEGFFEGAGFFLCLANFYLGPVPLPLYVPAALRLEDRHI